MTQAALTRYLSLGALLFLTGLLAACGPKPFQVPSSPMPQGGTYQGRWYSNFGPMELTQNGNEVQGTFEYKGEPGKIAGTIEGGVLIFDWVQEGDIARGKREQRGKGYFVMSKNDFDQLVLEGQWGYADKLTGGGNWTAEYLGE